MNDSIQTPVPDPADDAGWDRLLEKAGGFTPRTTFPDQVLRLVRVPLPRWMASIRDGVRGMFRGTRGWIMLGGLGVGSAAAWGLVIGITTTQTALVRRMASPFINYVLGPGWHQTTALVTEGYHLAVGAALGWLPIHGAALETALAAYAALALACFLAVRRLMSTPARARLSHVAR